MDEKSLKALIMRMAEIGGVLARLLQLAEQARQKQLRDEYKPYAWAEYLNLKTRLKALAATATEEAVEDFDPEMAWAIFAQATQADQALARARDWAVRYLNGPSGDAAMPVPVTWTAGQRQTLITSIQAALSEATTALGSLP